MSMGVSLFDFRALGSSPLLEEELEEGTGLSVSQAGLRFIWALSKHSFLPTQAFLSSTPQEN